MVRHRKTTTMYLKRGDDAPALRAVLMDLYDPVDLSEATDVRLVARRPNGTLVVDHQPVVRGSDVGEVLYQWQPGDTAEVGDLQVEIKVTWSAGGTQTFPAEGFLIVKVGEGTV